MSFNYESDIRQLIKSFGEISRQMFHLMGMTTIL